MATPTQIDQREQGQDRLLEKFKDKPNIEGTLNAYLTQTNDLEKVSFQLIQDRSLDTSKGAQLDILGGIVNESRDGRTDTDYLRALRFRIGANNSTGTPQELITLLKDVTLSQDVGYWEHPPASYFMSFDGDSIPNDFVKDFNNASPAAVNIGLLHDIDNRAWAGYDLTTTTNLDRATFGDTTDLLDGDKDLTLGYTSNNITTTISSVAPPVGRLDSAYRLTEDSSNTQRSLVKDNVAITTKDYLMCSYYVKPDIDRTGVVLQLSETGWDVRGNFNLTDSTTQTLSSSGIDDHTLFLEDQGDGWFKIILEVKPTIPTALVDISLSFSDTPADGQASYQGDGTSGILAFDPIIHEDRYTPKPVYFSDLYGGEGVGQAADIDFVISEAFNVQKFTGNGDIISIDVGFDISDNKSVSFIKNTSSSDIKWQQYISPLLGTSVFRRLVQLSGAVRTDGGITSFNPTGFTISETSLAAPQLDSMNGALDEISVITIRQATKFCDIISYTGDSNLIQDIPHSLNDSVAFMMISATTTTGATQTPVLWFKDFSSNQFISTSVVEEDVNVWASQLPTTDKFFVGQNEGTINLNEDGINYIAMVLADNPGNGIFVEEYIGDGTVGRKISIPFEAGMILSHSDTGALLLTDIETGVTRTRALVSAAGLSNISLYASIDPDGLELTVGLSNVLDTTYRFVAIKNPAVAPTIPPVVPVVLKENFSLNDYTGNGTSQDIVNGLDLLSNGAVVINYRLSVSSASTWAFPALGDNTFKDLWSTAETTDINSVSSYNSDGFSLGTAASWNNNNDKYVSASLLKAPGICDVVEYTGDGTLSKTITHSLGKDVAFMLVLRKSTVSLNIRWSKGFTNSEAVTGTTNLNIGAIWGGALPTNTQFTVGDIGGSNSGNTDGIEYICFLIADNPDAGITSGEYIGTGLDNTEIETGDPTGLLHIQPLGGSSVLYNVKAGDQAKQMIAGLTGTSNTFFNVPNTGKGFILSADSTLNNNGTKYFWFNIANPDA